MRRCVYLFGAGLVRKNRFQALKASLARGPVPVGISGAFAFHTDTHMALKFDDVPATEWRRHIDAMREAGRDILLEYGGDTDELYVDSGSMHVPIKNKTWATMVGIEHDLGTYWFTTRFSRTARGGLTRQPIGTNSYHALTAAILWNSAVYMYVTGKRLWRSAAECTAMECLKMSNCPEDMWLDASGAVQEYVDAVLAMASHGGSMTRTGLDLVASRNRLLRHLTRRCTNQQLRRSVAADLVSSGIADCKSREEQERMIADRIKCEWKLGRGSVRAVKRLLSKSSEYMGGVAPLLPYDGDGLTLNAHRAAKAAERYEELIAKKMRKEPLRACDRSFLSSYRKKKGLE